MNDLPDFEVLLGTFRRWLEAVRQEANQLVACPVGESTSQIEPGANGSVRTKPAGDPAPEVGLVDVVTEFTALRHEVKLQTKGTRALQEETERLLAALQSASDQFRSVAPREQQAARDAVKPWAEAVIDLDDSLDRARGEMERLRPRLVEEAARQLEQQLNEAYARMPGWRRWLCRHYHAAARDAVRRQAESLYRPAVDSLIDGFRLIQGRLERTMYKERLERIICLGRPVDPHAMNVVEVVCDSSHPPGTVTAELRRGYRWQGTVYRFAEVRAVKAE